LLLFSLQSHPSHSVYAENIPTTLDARITDKSQDDLINRMKELTIKPTDLPLRPDFGTVGPTFKMRTNFFPVKFPKRTIFEYDVAITPATAIRRVKRRIFELAEATNEWAQHLKGKVAHDFSSKVVSVNKLPDPLVIKIIFKDDDEDAKDAKDAKENKKQKPKEYTLTFKYVKDLDTSNLIEYVYLWFPVDTTTSLYLKVFSLGKIEPTRFSRSSLPLI
jgi:eukaryotic translation initiation factor 2C